MPKISKNDWLSVFQSNKSFSQQQNTGYAPSREKQIINYTQIWTKYLKKKKLPG